MSFPILAGFLRNPKRKHKCLSILILKLQNSEHISKLLNAGFPSATDCTAAALPAYLATGGRGDPTDDPSEAIEDVVTDAINTLNAEMPTLPAAICPSSHVNSVADFKSGFLPQLCRYVADHYSAPRRGAPPEPQGDRHKPPPASGAKASSSAP